MSVDAVAAMRSRQSGTGRRSGSPASGRPRRPVLPQRRYREVARQAARRWAQCRPTKRPSAGDGRCSDPPRGVPHVGDKCKGRLRPGRLQRISEKKTRSAFATTSSENLRKHGQREAAVKHGGYAAIRRIPRPRRGGGADSYPATPAHGLRGLGFYGGVEKRLEPPLRQCPNKSRI